MKEKVLRYLRESGGYVSGQELCEKLGVSRTSIWKAVNQLKSEGYQFEAVQNKGYRFLGAPDRVTSQEIAWRLHTRDVGRHICYVPTLDSTNRKAKELAEQGAKHGTLVVTDHQVAGQGRRGRQWTSLPAANILMTVILRPQILPPDASMLTLIAALAVSSGIREVGLQPEIKWPNDVLIGHKKICGILTEMSSEIDFVHYVVIGIGVNVNIDDMPEDLKDRATSLKMVMGQPVHRAELLAKIIDRFEKYYDCFMQRKDFSELKEEYNPLLVNQNRPVNVVYTTDRSFSGIARGINDRGELLVEIEDGSVVTVASGEVSVRGVDHYV